MGTLVTIRIPVEEDNMYKVLLVDDEGIVLDSLKFIINKNFGESCEIRTAKTGRQAIEIAQEFVPDISFMDIQMPGIKGIDAIREIRTFNKKCQFIIMSAYDKFTFAQEAINLGVIEYLTKPANREKIVAALEKAMAVIEPGTLQPQSEPSDPGKAGSSGSDYREWIYQSDSVSG